jgi:hypothetical protein
MKINLDENRRRSWHLSVMMLIPRRWKVSLVARTRMSGGLPQASQRFLVTRDLDFSDVRTFAPGTHRGLLLVRLRKPVGWRSETESCDFSHGAR